MNRSGGVLAIALGLFVVLVAAPGEAADPCPKGVQEHTKNGGGGEISWSSYAILPKIGDRDWCYHRTVVLHKPERQYVNWPRGEIYKKVVHREMTTWSCCYPDPRAEDAELEHGYSGKKLATQVYRGSREPTQNQTWVSVFGFVYVEPRTVRIDLTLRSSFRKTADGFNYFYEINNQADGVTAVWNSVESEFFLNKMKEGKISFPIKLPAQFGGVKVSGFSMNPADFRTRELVVLSEEGREVFRMLAPAYIPK